MRPERGNTSRPPAVAGLFYPDDERELRDVVSGYLRQHSSDAAARAPKALIVPHAGYIYSGSIAAAAYATVASLRQTIRRVVLIGPSHRVYLRGMALPAASAFATPLGDVAIDRTLKASLLQSGAAIESDIPHAQEHSLEVQLPFLQLLFDEFTLLPLVLGSVAPEHVAAALASVWGDTTTLVLVSSDLSHYHAYTQAQQIDAATSAAILRRDTTLAGEQACGAVGINGLLYLASQRQLPISELARCNSGDTAGDRSRVVGYGAFAVHEPGHA
jgi:AmmeMemoRadiSam system protein B